MKFKYKIRVIVAVFALFLSFSVIAENKNTKAKIVFEENFNGTNLNTKIWDYRQLNTYRINAWLTTNAVKVENGYLKMLVFSEPDTIGYKHYAGMISTQQSFNQKFGYFEARIKFSTQPGMWSAFWLQSPTVTADLPAEQAGVEIDIMEHRRVDKEGNDVSNNIEQTLHWGGYGENHKIKRFRKPDMGTGSDFHTYGVEWTADKYTFYYDGKPTVTWTRADNVPISQVAQYIILTTEIWNNNWVGNIPESGYGLREDTQAYMLVDWVKAYNECPY